MYCPRCATPNADGVKFCRSCGTELSGLALALGGKDAPVPEAGGGDESDSVRKVLVKHGEAVSGVTTGAILLTVSLLIGAAMALFVPADVPWMLVWMVFFGWLAVWGGIEMAYGVGGLIEAKSRLRMLGLVVKGLPPRSSDWMASSAGGTRTTQDISPVEASSPPLSVTEGTTRHLDEGRQD